MNKGKVGKPYRFSDILIIAGFAIKTIFKIGYREAAGNVSDYLSMNMIKESPDFRTMQWRISKMEKEGIKFMIYDKKREGLDDGLTVNRMRGFKKNAVHAFSCLIANFIEHFMN